ncbi:MAG: ThuA domain-containing protein [Hamadaea sp.]|nr:ThuA domain-containing protein [Hamadaea sp.]NUT19935.1 ThuA domain-containing protein [Hamadaea sp.]
MVRGGWDIHSPVEATDSFVPFLTEHGFTVEIADDLGAYADSALMAGVGLIVQCWTEGQLTDEQFAGLDRAVRAGAGFAGWHGGIVAAFARRDYQWLTGGWFLCHPGDLVAHTLTVTRPDHPITAGIGEVALETERYWLLADAHNEVLATITFPPEEPWREPVEHPAVWTRRWGDGRVFVSTVGHRMSDLDIPEIRTLTERGLLWAAASPTYVAGALDQGSGPNLAPRFDPEP